MIKYILLIKLNNYSILHGEYILDISHLKHTRKPKDKW